MQIRSIIFGILSLPICCLTLKTNAQVNTNGQVNTITTAVPFVTISPDARSGGVGDQGIALSPDANGAFWNVGKMAFVQKQYGFGLTYTPWLQELNINDIFLAHLDGYYKVDEVQTVGMNFRYFSLGSIPYTDPSGNPIGEGNPRELYVDGYYSRKFSDKFGAGITLRYIWSGITKGSYNPGGVVSSPASTFATDFGFHYTSNTKDENGVGDQFVAGLAIKNIGPKMSYDDTRKWPIPTNLGIGAAYTFQLDEYNEITAIGELNKLLVPTPQKDANGTYYYPDKPVLSGMFSSFTDAPGGGKEELQEWIWTLGVEYWYQQQFALRAGYFHEAETKGARQYLTLGLGVKYNVMGFNFSYIVPTNTGFGGRMPLSNTLRFSLLFDLNKGESLSGSSKSTTPKS